MFQNLTDRQAELFWEGVDVKGDDECWPWLKCKDKNGYGWTGPGYRSHRLSCFLEYGPAPMGKTHVLHSCDNPSCCNPAHLRWGTSRENIDDMVAKGRSLRGERHNLAKLTENQVLAIREDPRAQVEIAKDYGIDQTMVSLIKLRRSWKHLI